MPDLVNIANITTPTNTGMSIKTADPNEREENKERYTRNEGDPRNEIIQMQKAISEVMIQIKDIKSALTPPISDPVPTTNNNQQYVPQTNIQPNPMLYQQMENCMNVSNVPNNNNNYWWDQNKRATSLPPQMPGY